VNVRRFLWAALLVSLAVMLTTIFLQKRVDSQPAAPAEPPRGGAGAARASAETQPARGQPEEPESTTTSAPKEPAAAETVVASAPGGPATASATADQATWRNDSFEPHQVVLGSLDPEGEYKLQVRLTNLGAAVEDVRLAEYFETVNDKRRYLDDPDTYERAVREDPKLLGHYVLLGPVGTAENVAYPLATRRIRFPGQGNVALALSGPRWKAGKVTTDETGQKVTFTSEILRNGEDFVRLEKTYTLPKESYSLKISLRAENRAGEDVSVALVQYGPTGVRKEDVQRDRRSLAYGRYVKGELRVLKKGISEAAKMQPGLAGAQVLGRSDTAGPILWIGQTNKYFAALAYVQPKDGQDISAPQAKAEFFKAAWDDADLSRTHLAGMNLGAFDLPPGGSAEVKLDLFAGPKKRDLFKNTALYARLHYRDTLDFGSCFCAFQPLSLAMMWLLDFFGKATFGNYGLAIVLLVILVRIALHPLTKKGQVSMSRMQKLQPEMAKLREKYKNDKSKLNEEMMKLYKSQGASPMLGCLPMLLQFPIWIALWTGLQAAVELRHASFLPFWITDLAAPDALVDFGGKVVKIPLIGSFTGPITSFNLLPLLLAVAMALQQKFSPSTPGSDQQAKTQKNMMYFMTGFFLLVFYNAPSGLTMYIMASTFAGVAEQYVIRKHIREKEAAEAATETRVEMPGGRFRDQKPKKPKGPFRFTK